MLDLTQSVYRVVLIDSVCGLPKNSTPHICLCDVCYFYRPQRRCGQGNVFTAVCDSVYRGGSAKETPPRRRPPLPRRPPPQEGGPPKKEAPPRRRHPPGEHPPRRRPPKKETPRRRHPPEGDTPQEGDPPRRRHPPPSRLRHTVNEWPVCILLECILVLVLNVKSWVQLVSLHIRSM